MFRTLQDRLPKELALAGVRDVEAANRFIRDVYLPAHNARFAAEPADKASAFVPVAKAQWRDILCVQEERTVGNDNTVRWNALTLQIPQTRLRPHFVRAKVLVREYPDASLSVFWGPHRLADYKPDGSIIQHGETLAA